MSSSPEQTWSVPDLCFLFLRRDWCGCLMMQIKMREGDQDRVRLTGLRIKGGFKTAKVAAQQMHEVWSAHWSQKKKGASMKRKMAKWVGYGSGIEWHWMLNKQTAPKGDFISLNLKPLKSKQKGLATHMCARGSASPFRPPKASPTCTPEPLSTRLD